MGAQLPPLNIFYNSRDTLVSLFLFLWNVPILFLDAILKSLQMPLEQFSGIPVIAWNADNSGLERVCI